MAAANNQFMNSIFVKSSYGRYSMDEIIREFRSKLAESLNGSIIQKMVLFGSYAKNTAGDDSDIDICIIYDETAITEFKINIIVDSVADDLLGKYGVIIHALCFPSKYYSENRSSRLFTDVAREGVPC